MLNKQNCQHVGQSRAVTAYVRAYQVVEEIPALCAALYSPYRQALTMCEHLLNVCSEGGNAGKIGTKPRDVAHERAWPKKLSGSCQRIMPLYMYARQSVLQHLPEIVQVAITQELGTSPKPDIRQSARPYVGSSFTYAMSHMKS